MIYGSVCSGIEAATVAWHPLGWKAAFYSEIEKFPSAVLAHHYPAVPNLGDFTTIRPDQHEPIDLLVGGTPCQSFSIAGLRGGLGDDRGNLALEYLRLADRARPRWLVWENVPGVLSSNGGRDFGAILGGMVELGYGVAYRVLDAQFCRVGGFWRAVPQRRRRIFAVGYLGDWRRAAAVLFERACLLGDPAPGREAGEGTAGRIAPSLDASFGRLQGCSNQDANHGHSHLVAQALPFDTTQVTSKGNYSVPKLGDPCHPLAAGAHAPAIAFDCKASGQHGFGIIDAGRISPTLRAMQAGGKPNGGGQVAIAIQERAVSENPSAGPNGIGVRDDGAAYTIEARTVPQAVAFDMRGREGGAQFEGPHDTANIRAASGGSSRSYVAQTWAVRRLTPRECERLQGFPDDYTLIPWRGKEAPDGPRYKALGNSMAVNVMRWIGTRIEMVETLTASVQAA